MSIESVRFECPEDGLTTVIERLNDDLYISGTHKGEDKEVIAQVSLCFDTAHDGSVRLFEIKEKNDNPAPFPYQERKGEIKNRMVRVTANQGLSTDQIVTDLQDAHGLAAMYYKKLKEKTLRTKKEEGIFQLLKKVVNFSVAEYRQYGFRSP